MQIKKNNTPCEFNLEKDSRFLIEEKEPVGY